MRWQGAERPTSSCIGRLRLLSSSKQAECASGVWGRPTASSPAPPTQATIFVTCVQQRVACPSTGSFFPCASRVGIHLIRCVRMCVVSLCAVREDGRVASLVSAGAVVHPSHSCVVCGWAGLVAQSEANQRERAAILSSLTSGQPHCSSAPLALMGDRVSLAWLLQPTT